VDPGKILQSDSNLEVAVFDILGQRGVEELLEVLNQAPKQTFSTQETSVGDSLIDDYCEKIRKNSELVQGYMQKLSQSLEHSSSKVQTAHELIQRMLSQTMNQSAINLRNFVKSCYGYHNEVNI